MPPGRRRSRDATGAVLLEALVALALAGVAVMFLVGLLVHELRLGSRASRQSEALAALEAVVAGARVGALPLREASWTEPAPPWVPLPAGRGVTLWLEVAPAGVADLWTVTATIRYVAWNEVQSRTLTTRVWRPREET